MDYADRFKEDYYKSKTFISENDMLSFINNNVLNIDIKQIYTSNPHGLVNFHLMYTIKLEKDKVSI